MHSENQVLVLLMRLVGLKMDLARQLEAGDSYVDLDRKDAKAQWAKVKTDNPCESSVLRWGRGTDIPSDGFDLVAECTGVESIVDDAINYVARGGTLLVYGVYEEKARVSWPPSKIFVDEIK